MHESRTDRLVSAGDSVWSRACSMSNIGEEMLCVLCFIDNINGLILLSTKTLQMGLTYRRRWVFLS